MSAPVLEAYYDSETGEVGVRAAEKYEEALQNWVTDLHQGYKVSADEIQCIVSEVHHAGGRHDFLRPAIAFKNTNAERRSLESFAHIPYIPMAPRHHYFPTMAFQVVCVVDETSIDQRISEVPKEL